MNWHYLPRASDNIAANISFDREKETGRASVTVCVRVQKREEVEERKGEMKSTQMCFNDEKEEKKK